MTGLGLVALSVALVSIVAASVAGARDWRGRRQAQALLAEEYEHALVEDEVREAIEEVVERVHHYRHNIHCPTCGRFSRQAVGWPAGTADCTHHGLMGVHLSAIVCEAHPALGPEIPAETSPLIIEPPVQVPDDLSSLLEEISNSV